MSALAITLLACVGCLMSTRTPTAAPPPSDQHIAGSIPHPPPQPPAPVPAPRPAWHRAVEDDPALAVTTITISDTPRQVFQGFGSDLHRGAASGISPELHRELASITWGEGGLRIARLWYFVGQNGESGLASLRSNYIASGLIREALAAGATTLLLAPCGIPKSLLLKQAEPVLREGEEPGANLANDRKREFRTISDADVERIMTGIADSIATVKAEDGVEIHATGVMNEPNAADHLATVQIPLAVRILRRELDARGLRTVKIVAPETASVDWAYASRIQALREDPDAWSAIAGLAWHSYNMAMTPEHGKLGLETGKEMWMTEAGGNGKEASNDRVAAASLAARLANDLRLGATHWIWFISYHHADPRDDQTRLIRVFAKEKPERYERLGKFHVFRDICAAFPPGSRILDLSAKPGLRPWTYGRKGVLQATAARRPDGAVALSATNYTAPDFPAKDAKGSFHIDNAGLPAQTLRLRIALPMQTGAADVRRRHADLSVPIDERIAVVDGSVTVVLRPLETLTMVVRP